MLEWRAAHIEIKDQAPVRNRGIFDGTWQGTFASRQPQNGSFDLQNWSLIGI